MSRKQWIAGGVVLAAAIALLVSVFNPDFTQGKAKPEDVDIQLIMRTNGGEFWKNIAMGADAAVKEYGVTVHVSAPEGEADVEGQVRKAMLSLESNPDAIVLGANDDATFAPFLEEADKRGIPVIAIDSLLTSGKTTSYIGVDNFAAGQEAARKLAELIGGKGRVAVVNSGMGGINGELRERGILDAFADYPELETEERSCAGDAADCRREVGAMLAERTPDGILTLNTPSSEGAATALKERGLGGKVKLVGFDSSPELLELLQEEQLQALIVQNPFSIGYLGVKYAFEAASGKKVPEQVELDRNLIDKSNMFWRENQKLLFPVVQ